MDDRNRWEIKGGSRFYRNLVVAVLISVMGGGCIGLGIGIGIPVARYYFPDQKEEAARYREEEVALTFQHVPPGLTENESILGGSLSDIIKMVEPSVVSLVTMKQDDGDFSFFGLPSQMPSEGAGSGIIFSQDQDKLYIATNYHVIGSAKEVYVTKDESAQVPAKLIGQDQQADLAVICVSKAELRESGIQDLAIAVFGDSGSLQVGDTVLAIGNAFGLGNTATAGIISAKDKTVEISNRTLTVIQTDPAINEGNSGGPLINARGEVIGINTAKISSETVEGTGYCITVNEAKPIIEQIMRRVNGPFLGISGRTITQEIAELFGLPEIGVLVEEIIPGTSAAKAGIQPTDIIVSIDGESVFTMTQLAEAIQTFRVGDVIEVKLIRNGDILMTVRAKLEPYSEMEF